MDDAIVPDNKGDVVCAGDVHAHQLGNVDPRDHGGRYRPGGGDAPVAGIDQADRVIRERGRLERCSGYLGTGAIRRAPLPW